MLENLPETVERLNLSVPPGPAHETPDLPVIRMLPRDLEHEIRTDRNSFGPLALTDGEDKLSTSIRAVSQNLRTLRIAGVIGSDIFWPTHPTSYPKLALPFWPRLTTINVYFAPKTPLGKLMFVGVREQWNIQGRTFLMADQDELNKFYLAATRAMQNMPALQSMWLSAILLPRLGRHEFRLHVNERKKTVRAFLTSTVRFTPEERVKDMLQQFAAARDYELDYRVIHVLG